MGDDQRHPGRADGTAQGPGRRPRQLHDPRPAARLRCHADAAGAEKRSAAALADEAGAQGRSAGGELRRATRCRRRDLQLSGPGRAVDAQPAPGCALVRRAGASADGLNAATRQGADQLGAAHLCRRGRQGRDRRQRGSRRAGAQSRRRASADRRHAGVQCARPDALRGSGALAIVPVRPADGIVVAVRSVVSAHPARRCRPAHLRAEGRAQGLRPRPRCRDHRRALGQAARRHRRARSATGGKVERPNHRQQPTRSCRATPCAARSRTSMRARAGAAAVRLSGADRPLDALPRYRRLPGRRRPRWCAGCRARRP